MSYQSKLGLYRRLKSTVMASTWYMDVECTDEVRLGNAREITHRSVAEPPESHMTWPGPLPPTSMENLIADNFKDFQDLLIICRVCSKRPTKPRLQWAVRFLRWKGHERTTSRTRPHTVVQRAIFMITLGAMRCCPLHKFLATRESLRTIRLSRACMKKTIGETKAPVMIFRVHDTWTISVALFIDLKNWTYWTWSANAIQSTGLLVRGWSINCISFQLNPHDLLVDSLVEDRKLISVDCKYCHDIRMIFPWYPQHVCPFWIYHLVI